MADGKDSLINGDGINYGSPGATAVGHKGQQYAMGGKAEGTEDKGNADATQGSYPRGVTINPFTGYNSGNQTAGFGGSAIGVTYGDKPSETLFDKFKDIAGRVFGAYEKTGITPANGPAATAQPIDTVEIGGKKYKMADLGPVIAQAETAGQIKSV